MARRGRQPKSPSGLPQGSKVPIRASVAWSKGRDRLVIQFNPTTGGDLLKPFPYMYAVLSRDPLMAVWFIRIGCWSTPLEGVEPVARYIHKQEGAIRIQLGPQDYGDLSDVPLGKWTGTFSVRTGQVVLQKMAVRKPSVVKDGT